MESKRCEKIKQIGHGRKVVPKRQSEPRGQSEKSVRDSGPRGGPVGEGEKGAAQKGARARGGE